MESVVEIQAALDRARGATDALLAPVSDEGLAEHVSPLQLPLVWELARVAHFEELWLLRDLYRHAPVVDSHGEVHAAFAEARDGRSQLPPLRAEAARAYTADVRARVIEALEHTELDGPGPLLRKAFVFGLVLQHELQHQETMLQTLQLRTRVEYPVRDESPYGDISDGPDEIRVDGGSFILGATDEPWAYDNELVAHEVELDAFFIDRTPVTNSAFADFISHRGYSSQKHWSPDGWRWRERENATAPLFWEQGSDGWERIRFGRREPVPPRSRCSTSPGTRPTPTPAGPASASPPKRSGSEPQPGTSAGARIASPGAANGRDTRRISATAASHPLPRARLSAARARSGAAS